MLKYKINTTISNNLKKDYGSKLIKALKDTYKQSKIMDYSYSGSTISFAPKYDLVGTRWRMVIKSGQIFFNYKPENVTLKYQVSFPYLPFLFPVVALLMAHFQSGTKEFLLFFCLGLLPTFFCYFLAIMWVTSRKFADMRILKKEISILEKKIIKKTLNKRFKRDENTLAL